MASSILRGAANRPFDSLQPSDHRIPGGQIAIPRSNQDRCQVALAQSPQRPAEFTRQHRQLGGTESSRIAHAGDRDEPVWSCTVIVIPRARIVEEKWLAQFSANNAAFRKLRQQQVGLLQCRVGRTDFAMQLGADRLVQRLLSRNWLDADVMPHGHGVDWNLAVSCPAVRRPEYQP